MLDFTSHCRKGLNDDGTICRPMWMKYEKSFCRKYSRPTAFISIITIVPHQIDAVRRKREWKIPVTSINIHVHMNMDTCDSGTKWTHDSQSKMKVKHSINIWIQHTYSTWASTSTYLRYTWWTSHHYRKQGDSLQMTYPREENQWHKNIHLQCMLLGFNKQLVISKCW